MGFASLVNHFLNMQYNKLMYHSLT
uniref:Uncharacterized protein n=1 Tax=Rhizophora mucronata TaxID=61149 RepID=A0A2P2NAA4_RHIMU